MVLLVLGEKSSLKQIPRIRLVLLQQYISTSLTLYSHPCAFMSAWCTWCNSVPSVAIKYKYSDWNMKSSKENINNYDPSRNMLNMSFATWPFSSTIFHIIEDFYEFSKRFLQSDYTFLISCLRFARVLNFTMLGIDSIDKVIYIAAITFTNQ